MKSVGVFLLGLFVLVGGAGCGGGDNGTATPDSGDSVIVDTTVSVGAGGGSATISFRGEAGQTIRISLSSAGTLLPYGFLEPPGGNASYTPPLETAQGGGNSAEITLGTTGQFSLTIFDGNNAGGDVRVEITKVA